jgi:4-amino-4-deoxy-L-arabinose transferase-like glycosyltransferase
MPTGTLAARADSAWRRGWPEALLAVLAAAVFLGCLGSVELWGKREQRTAAEAIDTIDHHHWLVAEIQGRPRLEKPPLPRWAIAALMALTGRRDEWMVRLPGALCALATVALVYGLGRGMGGRSVGLAAALVLCSSGFFVGEMRQASNDAPLAMFTSLALFAAWRLLHDGHHPGEAPAPHGRTPGTRTWSLILHAALGLGFLTKGPIVLMLTAVAIGPYLVSTGRPVQGLRRLADGRGLILGTALMASWPAAVLVRDPQALGVWLTEVSEKTGVWQVLSHRRHSPLAEQWPGMVLPWSVIALVALVLPWLPRCGPRGGDARGTRHIGPGGSPLGLAWWWAVGNLGIFCLWAIAKPNYYLPCMPGMAVLIGAAWVDLARRARGRDRGAPWARWFLLAQWVFLFVGAVLSPLIARSWLPAALWPWTVALAGILAAAVVVSASAWRRGADALCLAPVTAAWALCVLIVYGLLAPAENAQRSHRALARTLRRLVPPDVRSIRFYNAIDEGLWFYLSGLDLLPVPETQPRYNPAHDLVEAYRIRRSPTATLDDLDARRQAQERCALRRWLEQEDRNTPYLLIRRNLYGQLAAELSGRVTPLYRESGLKRNELVLLRVQDRPPLAAATAATTRR